MATHSSANQLVLAAIKRTQATSYDPDTGNYNQFWIADRNFNNRTALVIDPPDGRHPGAHRVGARPPADAA